MDADCPVVAGGEPGAAALAVLGDVSGPECGTEPAVAGAAERADEVVAVVRHSAGRAELRPRHARSVAPATDNAGGRRSGPGHDENAPTGPGEGLIGAFVPRLGWGPCGAAGRWILRVVAKRKDLCQVGDCMNRRGGGTYLFVHRRVGVRKVRVCVEHWALNRQLIVKHTTEAS